MATISVNMKQLKSKWIVYADNVKFFEAITNAKGKFFTLDCRPYENWLNEFNIFYTITK
jgi:hypothetical protein